MAKIKYSPGIEEVIGSVNKAHKGIVQRRKHFRGPNGDVTKIGRIEAYILDNPRNFKINPAQGAELEHQTAFGKASKEANSLIQAVKKGTATPEQQTRYDSFVQRYYAQREGIPDPSAPLDEKGKGKIYGSFNCFVRMMIYYESLIP